MLRLIFGRAGSGKTRYALEAAGAAMEKGRHAVIVVPEQFTYETERALLRRLGPRSCLYVEVLSFSRMAHRVFGECGGVACRYIDDSGRALVMHRALQQVADRLGVYRRQAASPAFAGTMVQTVAEYKQCGVDSQALAQAAGQLDDPLLSQKLTDLSLIVGAYDAMLSAGFADSLDDLTRLAQALEDCPFFASRTVVLDSFKGFTPQERQVLAAILRQADEVAVTLCADRYGDEEGGIGLFSPVQKTARQLTALAGKCGVAVAKPLVLPGPFRFACESLRALEGRVFRPRAERYDGPAPEIHIVSASNLYDEAQFAAQEIARLVRTQGLRYRDFVVISRGLPMYRGILEPVFERYGVPLFFDTPRDVETHPLMALALSALDAAAADFRPEHVLRYLKTGLTGFSAMETAQVENYLLTWDIAGAESWRSPWQGNPDGFAGPLTGEGQARLDELNDLRARIAAPLLNLSQQLDEAAGASRMAEALYRLLVAVGADRAVADACRTLGDAGEVELADEYRQMWDKLMNVLDQTARTLGEDRMPPKEFAQLLRLCIVSTELSHIPPSLDEVTAGDAERIRASDAKIALVIGMAEGVFPRTHTPGGVITDAEREKLIRLGLELSAPAHEQAVEERFLAYTALTCSSQAIYLTCPRSDTAGRTMRPSQFLLHVKSLFPQCGVIEEALGDPLDSVQNEASAFDMLAMRYGVARNGEDALGRALLRYFKTLPAYAGRLAALEAAAGREPARLRDHAAARALFGERMHISPTRLETFGQCRFLYFCRYGLRAQTRRKAVLMAPEIGTLVHFVLERLLSGLEGRKLWEIAPEKLGETVDGLLDEFAAVYLGGLDDKPERFRYLYARLKETVMALVAHLAQELSQSEFFPVDYELKIAEDGDVAPVVIDLPDGGAIAVEGKVDRVDRMTSGGKTYLRVIDYKTGAKSFSLNDVAYGLNMQMLVYLFTLCENAAGRYGGAPLPAGILYMPAKKPEVVVPHGADDTEIRRGQSAELKMSGLIAAEPEVIRGMEQEARGIFIPARMKNDGEPDTLRSSIATFEQFGALQRHIGRILRAMAKTLRAGDIAAQPVEGLGYRPCDYCEFSAVCGHEKGDRVRWLYRFDKNDVWKQIEGDEPDA